jgi:hypothetical protein
MKGIIMPIQYMLRSDQDRRMLDLSSVRNIEKERRDYSADRRLAATAIELGESRRVVITDCWEIVEDDPTDT